MHYHILNLNIIIHIFLESCMQLLNSTLEFRTDRVRINKIKQLARDKSYLRH